MLKQPYFLINAKKKDSQMCQILDGFFLVFFCWNFFNPFLTFMMFCQILKGAGIGGGSRNPLQGWTPSFLKKQGIFYGYEVRKIRNKKYLEILY